jgi:membrane protein implicated in regulation of membrane protease activity
LVKQNSPRWHTVYSIISTVFEEAVIAAFIIWVLPLFGIDIPLWGLITILVAFAIYSYIMYRVGHPTISYKEVSSPESMTGNEGVVESELKPEGYVKVRGELWKASAGGERLGKGEEVVVTGIEGLKLSVKRKVAGKS